MAQPDINSTINKTSAPSRTSHREMRGFLFTFITFFVVDEGLFIASIFAQPTLTRREGERFHRKIYHVWLDGVAGFGL